MLQERVTNLITDYPGAPHRQKWWNLLDPAERERRERLGREPLDRPLAWEHPPKEPRDVEELRIFARTADSLPGWVGDLPALRYLSLPLRLAKSLRSTDVPATVEVLGFSGPGSVALSSRLSLPQVGFLLSNEGSLRFTRESFPSLTRLSLDVGKPHAMLERIGSYDRLVALHLSSVHDDEVFRHLDRCPLEHLGLFGGRLSSLAGIGAVAGLRSLAMKDLRKLRSLAGLEALAKLEALELGYATLSSADELGALPSLRALQHYGNCTVGGRKIEETLSRLGLSARLGVGGA